MILEEEKYKKISRLFLLLDDRFDELKKKKLINRIQKKEIEKKLRILSYWLLLNTPKNKNNPILLKGRINLCLNDFKKFNTRS
jgi:hypothetical protein